jgi:hypothetical protein
MLGENLPTIMEKRMFLNRQVVDFKNNLEASLTGIRGNNRSVTDSPASAKLHCYANEFKEELRKGKLVNINTIKVDSNVLVALQDGGEIRGKLKLLENDFACVDYVDEKDKRNVTMFEEGYCNQIKEVVSVTYKRIVGAVLHVSGSKYGIVREVLEGKQRKVDYFKKISLRNIRTDPSWLKFEIEKNRTQDLACFLNVDVFNSVVTKFIKEDWEPCCYDFLEKAVKLLEDTATATLLATSLGSHFPKVCTLIKIRITDLIKNANESAKKEIAQHLEIETYPYTQDHCS